MERFLPIRTMAVSPFWRLSRREASWTLPSVVEDLLGVWQPRWWRHQDPHADLKRFPGKKWLTLTFPPFSIKATNNLSRKAGRITYHIKICCMWAWSFHQFQSNPVIKDSRSTTRDSLLPFTIKVSIPKFQGTRPTFSTSLKTRAGLESLQLVCCSANKTIGY